MKYVIVVDHFTGEVLVNDMLTEEELRILRKPSVCGNRNFIIIIQNN